MLLGDRKLAGILTERVDTPTGPAVVVGVGINVDQTRDELPHDGATSLALEGVAVERTDLLSALLRSLRTEYDAFQRGELAALRSAYAASCATLGREVSVALPNGETAGRRGDRDRRGRPPAGVRTGRCGAGVRRRCRARDDRSVEEARQRLSRNPVRSATSTGVS